MNFKVGEDGLGSFRIHADYLWKKTIATTMLCLDATLFEPIFAEGATDIADAPSNFCIINVDARPNVLKQFAFINQSATGGH
jgi:hypothetical protein